MACQYLASSRRRGFKHAKHPQRRQVRRGACTGITLFDSSQRRLEIFMRVQRSAALMCWSNPLRAYAHRPSAETVSNGGGDRVGRAQLCGHGEP